MSGYFEIPVKETVVACQQAPDQRASDVIEQQRNKSGSGSSNSASAAN
ncbi:hypothetical protein FHS85_005014 [Rhodoligotrophos appendicifer]|nr:hypothetical protein [Rhodoligotrophos appendicifer]